MPFTPDSSVPALKKEDLKKVRLKNAKEREAASKFAAEAAKRQATLSSTITRLTGTQKTADTLGSLLARKNPLGAFGKTEDNKKFIPEPTTKEKWGAAANIALTAYPGGKIAQGIKAGFGAIGLKKAAPLASSVGKWAGAGYLADAAPKLENNQAGTPGAMTAIGAALPLAGPALRGVGRLAGNAAGISTGVGSGVIRTAYEAAKEGGKKAEAFTSALRGKTNPEELVEEAKGALGEIIQKRTNQYQQSLAGIAGMTNEIDTTPVYKAVDEGLKKFGVATTPEGLDFSRSTIRFNKKAQEDIRTIYEEMKTFGTKPGDNTPLGVDSLKRAFGDLYSESSEARSFIQGVTSKVRNILSQVPGYDKMSKEYGEQTDLIKEVQKGLSLGTKQSTDTAFRKLSTALKTNNEYRKQLVDELDKVTGGTLTAGIAGQQMSELAPRGLMRIAGGVGVGAGLMSGIGVIALLKAAALTSPRVVGEFINALGVTKKAGAKFLEKIGVPKMSPIRMPGDILLESPFLKKLLKQMQFKGGASLQDVRFLKGKDGKLAGSKPNTLQGINLNIGKVKSKDGKINENILHEIADFTEYAAKQKTGSKNELIPEEIRARLIAEKLSLNPEVSNWQLAKKFGKVLESQGYSR